MSLDLTFDVPVPVFAPHEIPAREPEAKRPEPMEAADPATRPLRPPLDPVACARKLAALARVLVRR